MGDKDYIPWSERLIAEGMSQGLSQGLSQGKMDEIFCSVYEKDYSLSRGAEKLNISEEEFSERYEKWKKEQQL